MQLPLAPPPVDENGEVLPHDHDGIEADHGVLRRITMHHLVQDEKAPNGRRLSSLAFQPSSGVNGGMSVDLENEIGAAGLDPKTYIVNPPFIGAVRFAVSSLRRLDFMVGYDPLPTNLHHGEVWGNFTSSKRKQLLALAEPFVDPT
jgi:hypothetical protein